jgi:penicillin amidase
MIVDFGKPSASIGVYPGGQSEDPASPLYSDQMSLWEKGQYLPLYVLSEPDKLPAEAKVRSLVFTPGAK